jgi:hypothetical protein
MRRANGVPDFEIPINGTGTGIIRVLFALWLIILTIPSMQVYIVHVENIYMYRFGG